eukprot:s723_g13.t1
MEDRTRAAGAAPDQALWEEEVNQKLGEAIIQVEALMWTKAKSSVTSTISSPSSYAKIAHLALLLCRSEIAREASLDTTPIDSSLEAAHPGGKWSKWREKQHREVTTAIDNLSGMLYTSDTSNTEAPQFPVELIPAAKVAKALLVQIQAAWLNSRGVIHESLAMEQGSALTRWTAATKGTQEQLITVYAQQDGDINVSHLVHYHHHNDVPYYMLEFILVWPTTQGLEQLYCKHFFANSQALYAKDLPGGWGGLAAVPTILNRVSLQCLGLKYYPYQQRSILAHTSGATIGGDNTGETNRVAWHVAYHEANALNIEPLNEQIHFDAEMSSMVRRSMPSSPTSAILSKRDRPYSISSNLALGRVWVHLQRALQTAETSPDLDNVKMDLAEVKDRVQSILNVQLGVQSKP